MAQWVNTYLIYCEILGEKHSWYYKFLIPTLGRLRQKDCKAKASLAYIQNKTLPP